MERMNAPEVEAVIKYGQMLLKAVSERVLTLLALLGCSCVFGYAMLYPDWMRFAGAAAFAVLVFWPCVRLEAAKKEDAQ